MGGSSEYGVASVDASGRDGASNDDPYHTLTDDIGCTEMDVAAVHLSVGASFDLSPDMDRVLLALTGPGEVRIDGRFHLPSTGIGQVPAGRPCTLTADGDATVLVVRTPGAGSGTEPVLLDLPGAEYVVPQTSDVATAHLTRRLGCGGVKVNARLLRAGQSVPLHTEGTQEELFVPLADEASVRVGEERLSTPRGTVVRVAPSTPRSASNDSSTDAYWVMFGAPPTGGPTEWDPGAEILE